MSRASLAWSLLLLAAIETACTLVLGVLDGYTRGDYVAAFVVASFAFLSFSTVGALVVSRFPENAVGWIFSVAPVLLMGANLAGVYAELAHDRALPAGVGVATATEWSWVLGLGLVVFVVPLLFPDGRPHSRRWRPVVWLAAIWLAASAVAVTLSPGPLTEPFEKVRNPLGVPGVDVLADGLLAVGAPVLLVLCIASLALRYRRADREQRQQLKWFLGAIVVTLAVLFLTVLADAVGGVRLPDAVVLAFIASIPASVGIAILRHRLYDIDVVINRTLVYGALTATLAGAYVGSVLLLQLALSPLTSESGLAIAASTLGVAALFRPARRRIQAGVDRRFFRRKYDAARTLEVFSARLRDELDLEALSAELRAVVAETVQPAHVSLWLRSGEAAR